MSDQDPSPLRRDRRSTAPRIVQESVSADRGPLGPDLVLPEPSARIPGDLRRPLTRFPTDPIGIVAPAPQFDPIALESEAEPTAGPEFWEPGPVSRRPWRAGWALATAIVALVISWFVGWGIPVALLSVGLAIAARRRPSEPRAVAVWALVIGLCATVFSLGWLVWLGTSLGLG